MNIIPPILAIILPLLAPFAQKLSADRLPLMVNAIIAAIIFVVAAVMWALFAQSLTGDPAKDLLLVAGYIAALVVDPTMKPLYALIIEAIHPTTVVSATPPVSPAAQTGIMLSSPSAPRASRATQATAPMPTQPPMQVEIDHSDHSGTV